MEIKNTTDLELNKLLIGKYDREFITDVDDFLGNTMYDIEKALKAFALEDIEQYMREHFYLTFDEGSMCRFFPFFSYINGGDINFDDYLEMCSPCIGQKYEAGKLGLAMDEIFYREDDSSHRIFDFDDYMKSDVFTYGLDKLCDYFIKERWIPEDIRYWLQRTAALFIINGMSMEHFLNALAYYGCYFIADNRDGDISDSMETTIRDSFVKIMFCVFLKDNRDVIRYNAMYNIDSYVFEVGNCKDSEALCLDSIKPFIINHFGRLFYKNSTALSIMEDAIHCIRHETIDGVELT